MIVPAADDATLTDFLARVGALAEAGNLAAVIVHVNDTYLIEARPPWIPGLARIAGGIARVREFVREHLGADLTLVCHGGDYLGPSRLGRQFGGAPMVELLRCCGVDFATLGNHEFDHDRPGVWNVLRARLGESRRADGPGRPFRTLLANLRPDRDAALVEPLALWPPAPATPLLALWGFAGEQTLKVGVAHGFTALERGPAFAALQALLQAQPEVLGVVVLSHASREEDRELQRWLAAALPGHAVYLLGGHDHHVHWVERAGAALLMKCYSNARSLGLIAVPRDGLAALRIGNPGFARDAELSREVELQIATELAGGTGERHLAAARLAQPERVVAECMAALRAARPGGLDETSLGAFDRRLAATLGDYRELLRTSLAVELCFDLASLALAEARRELYAVALSLDCAADAAGLPVDGVAAQAVAGWLARSREAPGSEQQVVDFSACTDRLDALDSSIRARSTDFGNFVADALRASQQAALALVNAGSLRADALLPPRLTRGHLRDVLLYDGPQAAVLLRLRPGELAAMLEHARRKGDHGAFLQVSTGVDEALRHAADELLPVVLVRHMLAAEHDEDGYCAALAAPDESVADLRARLLGRVECAGALEDWICAGAPAVAYSREARRVAAESPAPTLAEAREFIACVDRLRALCREAGLRADDLLALAERPALAGALDALAGFVARGHARGAGERDRWFTALYRQLAADEANYAGERLPGEAAPIGYERYLDRAAELFGRRAGLGPTVFRWLGGR